MKTCPLEYVRPDGDRHILRCPECDVEVRSRYANPAMRKQPCGSDKPRPVVSPKEARQLFGTDADDPTLLGNRLAALTSAIGIPPCGGCTKRKAWMNKAHAYLRSLVSG